MRSAPDQPRFFPFQRFKLTLAHLVFSLPSILNDFEHFLPFRLPDLWILFRTPPHARKGRCFFPSTGHPKSKKRTRFGKECLSFLRIRSRACAPFIPMMLLTNRFQIFFHPASGGASNPTEVLKQPLCCRHRFVPISASVSPGCDFKIERRRQNFPACPKNLWPTDHAALESLSTELNLTPETTMKAC